MTICYQECSVEGVSERRIRAGAKIIKEEEEEDEEEEEVQRIDLWPA